MIEKEEIFYDVARTSRSFSLSSNINNIAATIQKLWHPYHFYLLITLSILTEKKTTATAAEAILGTVFQSLSLSLCCL